MPILSHQEQSKFLEKLTSLMHLITQRRQTEAEHPEPPYNDHPTDYNFPHPEGYRLIHLAIMAGVRIEDIIELMDNEAGPNLLLTKTDGTQTPVECALIYGRADVFIEMVEKRLLPLDAIFSTIFRKNIDIDYVKKLYDFSIKTYILAPVLNNYKNTPFFERNTILVPIPMEFSEDFSNRIYLNYAAEIGDVEFINTFFDANQSVLPLLSLDEFKVNPLLSAIENKQYKALEALLSFIEVDPKDEYAYSPLHVAAERGDWESAEILFNFKVSEEKQHRPININRQDRLGRTPLFLALEKGHVDMARKLLNRNPDVTITTFTGETLFHAAINCPHEFQKELASIIHSSELESKRNIYGQTPEEYIKRFDSISQEKIIEKIGYYSLLNYRDQNYFSSDGYCNALSFLYQYFHSKNMQTFRSLLNTITTWDPLNDDLENIPIAPLDRLFKTKREVFETFINWLNWYQHINEISKYSLLEQSDREFQFEDDICYVIKNLEYDEISKEQFRELQEIFISFPINMRIESGGAGHIVSYNIIDDSSTCQKKFNYYDSNLDVALPIHIDSKELTEIIIDIKYKMMRGISKITNSRISIFTFPWDKVDLTTFRYFDDSTSSRKLPTSEKNYTDFISSSSNGFTPLHIAALTHSIEDVLKLINMTFCQINRKDVHDMTAFDIAVKSGNPVFCELFLKSPEIDLKNTEAAVIAYRHHFNEVMDIIINHPKACNLSKLFQAALFNNDFELVKKLIELKKVDSVDIAYGLLKPQLHILFHTKGIKITEEDFQKTINKWKERNEEKNSYNDILILQDTDMEWKQCFYNFKEKEYELIDSFSPSSSYLDTLQKANISSSHRLFQEIMEKLGYFPEHTVSIQYDSLEIKNNTKSEIIDYLREIYEKFDINEIAHGLAESGKPRTLYEHYRTLNNHLNIDYSRWFVDLVSLYSHHEYDSRNMLEYLLNKFLHQKKDLPLLSLEQGFYLLRFIFFYDRHQSILSDENLNKLIKSLPLHDLKNNFIFLESLLRWSVLEKNTLALQKLLPYFDFDNILNEEKTVLHTLVDLYDSHAEENKIFLLGMISIFCEQGADLTKKYDHGVSIMEYAKSKSNCQPLTDLFNEVISKKNPGYKI